MCNNVILASVARSGSTLTCRLLNELPNVVASDEPFERDEIRTCPPAHFVHFVETRFQHLRQMLDAEQHLISSQVNKQLDNHYAEHVAQNSLRRRVTNMGKIKVGKPLNGDYLVVMKHTLCFTAYVKEFTLHYPTYAVVRNPLAILASWNSIDSAYNTGFVPEYAVPHVASLTCRLEQIQDVLAKQIRLLSWHFECFQPLLAQNRVIFYEQLIASQGQALEVITSKASTLQMCLENKNHNPLYDSALMLKIGDALLSSSGDFWDFYPRDSVENLMMQIETNHSK